MLSGKAGKSFSPRTRVPRHNAGIMYVCSVYRENQMVNKNCRTPLFETPRKIIKLATIAALNALHAILEGRQTQQAPKTAYSTNQSRSEMELVQVKREARNATDQSKCGASTIQRSQKQLWQI